MIGTIKLNNTWQIREQMDAGGFGSVYHALSSDGRPVVAKFVPKKPGATRELLFDNDLKRVPNVVPILDQGEWEDYLVLVMPKADNQLSNYLEENIGHLSIDDTLRVLIDVTEALVAMEGSIVHRDIKPDNILLLNGRWCLSDFGISKYAEATTSPNTHKYFMTPPYAAPEQWRGERASSATDIYAMGVVAYQLLAGRLPFEGPEQHDYRRQHLEDIPEPVLGIPTHLQALIDESLYKSPQARPTPQNLLARLREGFKPVSVSSYRLQQANLIVVQERAEKSRQQSLARSEGERREQLCASAEHSLGVVIDLLHQQIIADASATAFSGPMPEWSWSLAKATLVVLPSRMASFQADSRAYGPPFDVVAYSSILLRAPQALHSYEGRSHSLWYCDAQEAGVFRWYETAFMVMPSIAKRSVIDPFDLDPGNDAYGALSTVLTSYQVAWPFTAVDQGDESEFIERWIGWFADASQGQLQYPKNMPERDPKGTWRRQ